MRRAPDRHVQPKQAVVEQVEREGHNKEDKAGQDDQKAPALHGQATSKLEADQGKYDRVAAQIEDMWWDQVVAKVAKMPGHIPAGAGVLQGERKHPQAKDAP